MEQRLEHLRRLELGGGDVSGTAITRLALPAGTCTYSDAQLDDYGDAGSRGAYPWSPETRLTLRARFSHAQDELVGTAGFGFWNAPFGDPSIRRPALPQATWFFFAAPPTNLPLADEKPGRGWFASTIDAARLQAVALVPLAPLVLIANQSATLRRFLWPSVQRHMGISFAPVEWDLPSWHTYDLQWRVDGCHFEVDGECILHTPHSPKGPLGFVCWIDNQYLIVTPRGRLAWGITPTSMIQWLEIADLTISEL